MSLAKVILGVVMAAAVTGCKRAEDRTAPQGNIQELPSGMQSDIEGTNVNPQGLPSDENVTAEPTLQGQPEGMEQQEQEPYAEPMGEEPTEGTGGAGQEGMEPQGMEPQGMEPQGMEPQGMEPQGMEQEQGGMMMDDEGLPMGDGGM